MSEENVESFDCDCEFDFPEGDSWHYWRTCKACGFRWGGLHCPHDGYQNPCPSCGVRPEPEPIVPAKENVEYFCPLCGEKMLHLRGFGSHGFGGERRVCLSCWMKEAI